MDAISAVRAVTDRSSKSMRAVSVDMGRSPGFISSMLTQGSTPGADTLAAIGAACGYSLALVPSGRVPEGSIVIDPPR